MSKIQAARLHLVQDLCSSFRHRQSVTWNWSYVMQLIRDVMSKGQAAGLNPVQDLCSLRTTQFIFIPASSHMAVVICPAVDQGCDE